jgi:hypothetical protein
MYQINHNTYPESLKALPTDALYTIMRDAAQAIQAMPDGPKAGYYQDEINYCCNELNARRAK